MVKGRLFFILLISVLVFRLNAQSNFIKGYIVTSNFDTINGEINNQDYYLNSQYCEFKDVKKDSIIKFTPEEIYGYRFIDGKYYVSIEINDNKLFLEYLINGNLNIYFYQDKEGYNHYFASKDTLPLRELKYSEELRAIDGKEYLYESNQSAKLLYYYTNDCPAIKEDISRLKAPNHNNLIKVAKEYHNLTCKDEKCIVYEKSIRNKIKFDVFSGGNVFNSYFDDATNHSIQPTFGFNFLFQQIQTQESLYLGIGFVSEGKIDRSTYFYRIPLSINYLSPRLGFSPCFSYELDLNTFMASQAINLGLQYQMEKVAFFSVASVKTSMFMHPYSVALKIGLTFDLRKSK